MKSKLLLVDGHAYAYRAYYAIRSLQSPEGRSTNAIYGFIKMLGRLRERIEPSHVGVIWDGGLSSERLELAPDYKAQRPEMPDDLGGQIEEIQEYLGCAGMASLRADGIEADDWIAALARNASSRGMQVVIASSDKDFFQLVSPAIGLMNPADKSEKIWSAEDVRQKTGVGPDQIVDWLSLMGDAVDNIAGVPGVGPKTAADLINKHGSVDALYSRLNDVTSDRLRNALAAAEGDVRRNQEMVRLKFDVSPVTALEDLAVGVGDSSRLLALARKWGFRGMIAELEAQRAGQQQLFAA